MDELDFGILLEWGRTPFASWESIGRTVGLTGTTARARWARMRDSGLVKVLPVVDPRALRRDARLFVFEGREMTEPLAARVLRVPGVAWCAGGYPDTIAVMTCSAQGHPPSADDVAGWWGPPRSPPSTLCRRAGTG